MFRDIEMGGCCQQLHQNVVFSSINCIGECSGQNMTLPLGPPDQSRIGGARHSRVFVITLKFLALKKIGFSPVKNTSKPFFLVRTLQL